jgi:hypothetical protein
LRSLRAGVAAFALHAGIALRPGVAASALHALHAGIALRPGVAALALHALHAGIALRPGVAAFALHALHAGIASRPGVAAFALHARIALRACVAFVCAARAEERAADRHVSVKVRTALPGAHPRLHDARARVAEHAALRRKGPQHQVAAVDPRPARAGLQPRMRVVRDQQIVGLRASHDGERVDLEQSTDRVDRHRYRAADRHRHGAVKRGLAEAHHLTDRRRHIRNDKRLGKCQRAARKRQQGGRILRGDVRVVANRALFHL